MIAAGVSVGVEEGEGVAGSPSELEAVLTIVGISAGWWSVWACCVRKWDLPWDRQVEMEGIQISNEELKWGSVFSIFYFNKINSCLIKETISQLLPGEMTF